MAIQAIEDQLHDAYDDDQTPDIDRPGLRRAARICRATRRTIADESTGATP